MALGAQARSIVSAVMRSGLTIVGLGIALGAVGAIAAGRAISGMLFQTTTHDTVTYAVVALVILATSALATVVPAMRATRVHPTEALRS